VLLCAPVVWAEPRVAVDPREALVDAPPRIRVDGFPTRQPITVTATLAIPDVGTWHSSAVFRADDAGSVDAATTAPIWPSFALAEIARERLVAHRHPFPVVHLSYEGAGHSIGAPYGPTAGSTTMTHPVTGGRYALGGTPRANAEAAAGSWPKVLEFLERARASRP
jgi:hypothetical protein